jgi:hypothetical protein
MCIFGSLRFGLPGGIANGLFSALIIVLVLGAYHKWSVRRILGKSSEEITDEALGVEHERSIDLNMSWDKAFALCLGCLHLMGEFRIEIEDHSPSRIYAKKGTRWTGGSEVSFSLKVISGELTHIEVSSRPTSRWTGVDFGKNLAIVERIIGYLRSQDARSESQVLAAS